MTNEELTETLLESESFLDALNQAEWDFMQPHIVNLLDRAVEEFKESAHYKWLLKRESWLTCLESAGVDNWSGYEHAIDIRDGYNDDNDDNA